MKFNQYIEQVIEKEADTLKNSIKEYFWTELLPVLETKLSVDANNKLLDVTSNFCLGFRTYWSNERDISYLKKIVSNLFERFYGLFNKTLSENNNNFSVIYLKCLTRICTYFMNSDLFDLMFCIESNNLKEKIEFFNTSFFKDLLKMILIKNDENMLAGAVDFFLTVNLNIGVEQSYIFAKLDNYFFELANEKTFLVEGIIKMYLFESSAKIINPKIKTSFTEWILLSQQACDLVLNNIFIQSRIFTETEKREEQLPVLAIQLLENLLTFEEISKSKPNIVLQKVFLYFLNAIDLSISNMVNSDKSINENETKNCFRFTLDLLFNSNITSNVAWKLLDLKTLWNLLLNTLLLKSTLSQMGSTIDKSLNDLIERLTNKLMNDYLLDAEIGTSVFNPLLDFIKKNLHNKKSQLLLNSILLNLINQFSLDFEKHKINESARKRWLMEFYLNVLFNMDTIKFKDIFKQLSQNIDFIKKLYLDKRLNYTHTNVHHHLVSNKLDTCANEDEQIRLILNKLNIFPELNCLLYLM